jgi:uncharacterized membrane protein
MSVNVVKMKWPLWRLTLMGLGAIAAVLSLILSWHVFSGNAMLGCNPGSSCNEVMQSHWSMVAGLLPVSSLAVSVYLALLAALFFIGPETEKPVRLLAWKVLMVLAGAILGSAIWFTVVQKWMIGAFCPYCMTAHTTGVVVTVLLLFRAFKETEANEDLAAQAKQTPFKKAEAKASEQGVRLLKPKQVIGLYLVGLLFSGVLAVAQVTLNSTAQCKTGEAPESLPTVNVQDAPIIGPRDAAHTLFLLFDYNCAHCQKIHFMVQEMVERYKGQLAVVLCPTPLNTHCNAYVPKDVEAFSTSCELTRIGLAVWRANPSAFNDFEQFMFTFESGSRWVSRTPEAARGKAIELVGQPAFESAVKDPWIDGYIKSCVQLFGHTLQGGKGGIPKLVYGSRWVIPQPEQTDDLMTIVQTSFSLPKPME